MSTATAEKQISVEEYLATEASALEKHEYYQGEIFPMSGASFIHNTIVRNTLSEIDHFLKGKQCSIYPSDLKVHIPENTLFTYPDLSIICGKPVFWNNRTDTITNPSVIFEVLSKKTAGYDRGDKFRLYQDIASLNEYILISSKEIRLEQYVKQADNEWKYSVYRSPEDAITIHTIGFTTRLQEFYRDVDFSLAEEASDIHA